METSENKQTRVLVVDDDPDLLATVEIQLHLKGYRVQTADTAASGIEAASQMQPDIVLLDIGLPDKGGLEVIKELRSRFSTACSGIIMLTALSEQSVMREAVANGADDYLLKPYDPAELCNRIEMVKERTARNLERNPLTGLPGNNLIQKELQHRLEMETPFVLGYVDIDNFKAFNDRYGPDMGDKAIHILSEVLGRVAIKWGNPNDFIGHIGGDDFVFLSSPDNIEKLCKEMFYEFEKETAPLYTPEDLARGGIEAKGRDGVRRFFPRCSLSVGAASSQHSRIEKPQRAFEFATQAKHSAKSHAGDFLVIWGVSEDTSDDDSPKRLLIIETSREGSYRLAFEMTQKGYECRTAENGMDALSALSVYKPDLLLFNPLLPRLADGQNILERFTAELGDGLPVIYLASPKHKPLLQVHGITDPIVSLPDEIDLAHELVDSLLPL